MSWARILENDASHGQPLRQRIDALFAQQRQTWPAFRDAEAALERLPTKTLTDGHDSVIVQLNAGRRPSVLAKTDPASIAARPCFLCSENMPLEERGVAFGDLVVLPNPCPCLPMHATIASRAHEPQRIGRRIASCLNLAQLLGPDLAVTYNGPECGASAPDHFHFQCVRVEGLPIFAQLPMSARRAGVSSYSHFGRKMLTFARTDMAQMQSLIEDAIGASGQAAPFNDKRMINLAAWFDGEWFNVLLFPRTRHRPACYFATGPERIAVSPGVLEMCGLFVVTHESDFERMTAETVRSIYQEVCAPR